MSRQWLSRRWRGGCLLGKGRGLSSKGYPEVRFVYLIHVYIPIQTYCIDAHTVSVWFIWKIAQPRSSGLSVSRRPRRGGGGDELPLPGPGPWFLLLPLFSSPFLSLSYCNTISWEALKPSSLFPSRAPFFRASGASLRTWTPATGAPEQQGYPLPFPLGPGEPGL